MSGSRGGRRWLLVAVVALLAVPYVPGIDTDFGRSVLTQMAIAAVFALSFNMLFGQTGLLSFGHAVYFGLGGYAAIHVMRAINQGLLLPMVLVPLAGAAGGLLGGLVFGAMTTRRSGTIFALISLGVGELVYAATFMLPGIFGGEEGITASRTRATVDFGFPLGSQLQVYYAVLLWTVAAALAMYAFTRTPAGRMCNAVRDNPERAEFIGYNTQRVRYFAFIIAGFFAGIAGGMYALNFEIATAEVVGAGRSGVYLLFTFLGGATIFFGPIIGAVLMVVATVLLSEFTKAWLLYLGLVFLFMVMYAPGGIASLIMMNVRVAAYGKLRRLLPWHFGLTATALVMLFGAAAMIEMVYHMQLNAAFGSRLVFMHIPLDAASMASWAGAALITLVGIAAFELTRRRFARHWGDVQGEIAHHVRAKETTEGGAAIAAEATA
jgi:branched-chain amino acid transport system permease protein